MGFFILNITCIKIAKNKILNLYLILSLDVRFAELSAIFELSLHENLSFRHFTPTIIMHISIQCLGSHVGLYFATVYICIYEMLITLVLGANVNKNTNYDTYVIKLQSNCKWGFRAKESLFFI
jgi:hypothetical protein